MTFYFANGLATLSCLLSAVLFYLGCPNQQWFSRQVLCFYPALVMSLLLAVLGAYLFLFHFDTLPTIFTVLSLLMLGLGAAPFLGRLNSPAFAIKNSKKPIDKSANGNDHQNHWWRKTLLGIFLGFPLAVCLAGLLSWWGSGEVTHNTKSQLVMWLVTPLWLLPLSLVFLTANFKRALASYAVAGTVVGGLLWLVKTGTV